MNPLSLHVLVVTTTGAHEKATRTFVDASEYRLRELGLKLIADKPAEAAHVSFDVYPAEGVQ